MATALVALSFAALLLAPALGRDDGLARTPPMGWSTWYAFGANLNETRVVQMADAIVSTGLRDAGYRFVNLDDAWLSPSRDRYGNLQGDLVRFPSGIKWLADEMHSRGLLLGLYGCPGVRTCEGYPGQFEHEYQDAATIAAWGVDAWKHDNCWQKWAVVDTYTPDLSNGSYPSSEAAVRQFLHQREYGLNVRGLSSAGEDAMPINWNGVAGLPAFLPDTCPPEGGHQMGDPTGHQIQQFEAYRLFGEALVATGRNITYSICPYIAGCDASVFEYYRDYSHMSMNQCPQIDNTDTWASFTLHLDANNYAPSRAVALARAAAAGPGYFNDLDQLMIGFKLLKAWEPRQTLVEYRSQFSLFAVLAAPLIFSADIRGTDPFNAWTNDTASVLLNKAVIAVSQDPLGQQGVLVANVTADVELYRRELADGGFALAVLNRAAAPIATPLSVSWAQAGGIPAGAAVAAVADLWQGGAAVPFTAQGFAVAALDSHDTALLRVALTHAAA
jgi:alpha-galactosidase